MSKEIYAVTFANGEITYVEANTKNQAVRAAYTLASATKLSGSEVRALPAGTAILSAADSDNAPDPA